ncbi:MAG: ECF-type sigma factor, partial [Thermoanaerobaculia bacterium]
MAGEITQLLHQLRDGDRQALNRLVPLVYNELRGLAHRQMARRPSGLPLDTTSLMHEAYGRSLSIWPERFEIHLWGSLVLVRVQKSIEDVLSCSLESHPFRTACRSTDTIVDRRRVGWRLNKSVNMIWGEKVVLLPGVPYRTKGRLPIAAVGRETCTHPTLVT